jgi:SMI1-KNR4 cell-wall
MNDLDELTSLVAPPDEPPPPVDWAAARAALGAELPADYRALVERYGGGSIAGLRVLVPGHPNRHADLVQQVEPQRWALQYLIDAGIEQPYAPEELLPWGIDEGGNAVWWLTQGSWPVVANEARGEEWYRHDGGAVSFLTSILSGRETSDFLVIEGDDFEPYEPESGP